MRACNATSVPGPSSTKSPGLISGSERQDFLRRVSVPRAGQPQRRSTARRLAPRAGGTGAEPSRELTSAEKAEEKAEELRAFNTREQDAAWRSIAYLLSGPLIYGGLGYLLDRWLGTNWIVGAGIVGGMVLSLYLIWFRYGSD